MIVWQNRSYKVTSRQVNNCEKVEREPSSESRGSRQINDHLRKYWEQENQHETARIARGYKAQDFMIYLAKSPEEKQKEPKTKQTS